MVFDNLVGYIGPFEKAYGAWARVATVTPLIRLHNFTKKVLDGGNDLRASGGVFA